MQRKQLEDISSESTEFVENISPSKKAPKDVNIEASNADQEESIKFDCFSPKLESKYALYSNRNSKQYTFSELQDNQIKS